MMKKAITHLRLDQANPGKLQKLDELAAEHQRVAQAYVDWLIRHEVRQPDKYAPVPEQDIPTSLSDRWQRCAWQQACGIVQSWYSNDRKKHPSCIMSASRPTPMCWSSNHAGQPSSIFGSGSLRLKQDIRFVSRSSYTGMPKKCWRISQNCAAV
jgi:hypothetical protein